MLSSGPKLTTTSAATALSAATPTITANFDGIEREFHGFGLVEQIDTEEFAALNQFAIRFEAIEF
jgi:hypothetical protein